MGEAAYDGQPETGAAKASRRRGVRLGERFEDAFQAVRGDADAGIGDLQLGAQSSVAIFEFKKSVDVALLGEFHGVTDEVGDNPAEFDGISHD